MTDVSTPPPESRTENSWQGFFKEAGTTFSGTIAAIALAAVFAVPWINSRFSFQDQRLAVLEGDIGQTLSAVEFQETNAKMVETMARQQARTDKFLGEASGYLNEVFPLQFLSDLEKTDRSRYLKLTKFENEYWMFIDRENLTKFSMQEQQELNSHLEMHRVRLVIDD